MLACCSALSGHGHGVRRVLCPLHEKLCDSGGGGGGVRVCVRVCARVSGGGAWLREPA